MSSKYPICFSAYAQVSWALAEGMTWLSPMVTLPMISLSLVSLLDVSIYKIYSVQIR